MADHNSWMFSYLAETPIHVGVGQVGGTVDLPVARDGITQHPVIPGSGLKGAIRARCEAETAANVAVEQIFGPELDKGGSAAAGAVLFGDARLLLLPIRSLNASYLWATCPMILERFQRDCRRVFGASSPFIVPDLKQLYPQKPDRVVALAKLGSVLLEEWHYGVDSLDEVADLITVLAKLLPSALGDPDWKARLDARLVILHDDEFLWFARHGLPVNAHNKLNDETKESEALWYEETLPTDSLLYAPMIRRAAAKTGADSVQPFIAAFKSFGYLQVGGNETVGHGWLRLADVGGG